MRKIANLELDGCVKLEGTTNEPWKDLSDEQCLQQAADIRVVLNEAFDKISWLLQDDETLKAAVRRLQGP